MKKDTEKEVRRRIKIGWKSFFKNKEFLTGKRVGMILKRRLFNTCVLPAMLYGSQTWTMTKKIEMMMEVAQRRMERMMARVTLRDRKTNEWLRAVTKVKDFVKCARKRKIQWARKLALMNVNNWARCSTQWQPRIGKRNRGRPKMRWRDSICKIAGQAWMRKATNDDIWSDLEEAFVCNEQL
ncbi:hypothetical protein AB6A40_006225 [Gnathostoma spinigerum]|uniref:Endonuclease-reverse transcriptase n=1 Tax=Gnathostoma spinigerum TaxID=75299 RepID=A0ABD6EJU7_9BILA